MAILIPSPLWRLCVVAILVAGNSRAPVVQPLPSRTGGVQRRGGRREELCVVNSAREQLRFNEANVRPRGFKRRIGDGSPNPAARVVSGVFGAVGLTNRRASRALVQMGLALDSIAERAESISKLVRYVGRRPRRIVLEPHEEPFFLDRNESQWPQDWLAVKVTEFSQASFAGASFVEGSFAEPLLSNPAMPKVSFVAEPALAKLASHKASLAHAISIDQAAAEPAKPVKSEAAPAEPALGDPVFVEPKVAESDFAEPDFADMRTESSSEWACFAKASLRVLRYAFLAMSGPTQRAPLWVIALALLALGRATASESRRTRRLALLASIIAIGVMTQLAQDESKPVVVRARRRSPVSEDQSLERETMRWLLAMQEATWTGGGSTGGGLSAYLAEKAGDIIAEGLRESFGSSLQLDNLAVDFGAQAPRLARAARLRESPQFLADALGGSSLHAFIIELEPWRFVPRQNSTSFLTAEIQLTGSIKYAVPHLGLVLDDAELSRSAAVVAIDFVPDYPFVGNAAIAFLSDDLPTLSSRALVGATTTSDLFDFAPFARLIDDEFKRNLPVVPRPYIFDLGRWLTECATLEPTLAEPVMVPNETTTAVETTTVVPAWRRRKQSSPQTERKRETRTHHGPFAGLRAWVQRRRQKGITRHLPVVAEPSLTGQSNALRSRDLESRQRLEDEKRKLFDAATAVRRERDRFVAAAMSTRQAFSDRVVVAFKLQLAEELQSLGGVVSGSSSDTARKDKATRDFAKQRRGRKDHRHDHHRTR